MYILLLSRGIPSKYHPQWGCFEKDQAEALVAYGHKVVVLSVDSRFKWHRGHFGVHHIVKNGVDYYNDVTIPGIFYMKIFGRDFYRKRFRFHAFDRLYQHVVSEHGIPDIIYSQYIFNTVTGVQLKQKYKIPLVGIEHFSAFNEPVLPKELESWGTFAFNGVDKLICVSRSLSDNIERRFNVSSIVVHNLVGPEFIDRPLNDTSEEGPLVFISAASLTFRKGFDMLIKAFAKVQLPKEIWKLNIIGWGEEQKKLEQLRENLGLQDNVFLLGKKGKIEIADELCQSNVFVLPSRNENFSVAILEGLAMGLPVIATDCGGIRECLDDKNGIIVPVDDIDSMAAAITQMIGTYTKYDRKCIAEACRQRYSPMAIAEQLTAVFEDTINTAANFKK